MKQSFIAQFFQLLERDFLNVWPGVIVQKDGAFPSDQRSMFNAQFLMYFLDSMAAFLRSDGFTCIQKAVLDNTSGRPPDSHHDFLLVQLRLREVFRSFVMVN